MASSTPAATGAAKAAKGVSKVPAVPRNPLWRRLLNPPLCSIFIICGVWVTLANVIIAGALFFVIPLPIYVALLATYLGYIFTSKHHRNGRQPRLSHYDGGRFWKWAKNYYPMKVEKLSELSPDRKYILAAHPHGVIWITGGYFLWDVEDIFPGVDFRGLAASILFRIPIVREVHLWNGYIDAGRSTVKAALDSGKSIALSPGGEIEGVYAEPGKEILELHSRKGFVRLALQTGADLVPAYSFGLVDVFHQYRGPRFMHKAVYRAQVWFVKRWRTFLSLYYGRAPFLAYSRPITFVIGAPLHVEKIEHPTDAQVNELHAKYVAALTKLFDENKARLGFGDRKLTIK
eukprot:tig00020614_g12218.t1